MTSAITAPRFDPWRTHAVRVARQTSEVPGVFTCDLAISLGWGKSRYRFAMIRSQEALSRTLFESPAM